MRLSGRSLSPGSTSKMFAIKMKKKSEASSGM